MRIEHIAMYVNDLEKTRDFFIQYFNATSNEGYHNKKTDFRSFFLSFDDGARLEIMNRPQMKDDEKGWNHTGYIHIAFSVPRTTGDGYYESCIVGMEGNLIEITE